MKSTQRANRVLLFIIILFALPGVSHAAVIINEVMYDPPGSNTKAQWLELYNNGDSTVDLSKWSVTDGAKGSSGNLTKHAFNVPPKNGGIGSATIPAGGYVVVADDAATFESVYPSVPNVVDSVFSLSNVASLGAEVDLVDAQGNTADTLTFSADQYASNLGNSVQRAADKLVSALPTPGAANATSDYIPPSDDEDSSNTDSDTNTSNTTSDPGYVSPPLPQIFADAGGDRSVIVGADAKFVASAYDRDRSVIKYAKFSWNFGDGSEAEGPWVMHHFSYPGRYAVELTITNQKLVSSDRITVVAEPADVTLATLSDGGVSIQNRSDHDLDLSFWKVAEGSADFTLPEHSAVLKGSSINIAPAVLGFGASADTQLRYPDDSKVLAADDIAVVPAVSPEPATSVAPASEPVVQPDPVYVEPATPEASDVDTQQSAAEPTLSDEPVPLEVIPPPNLIPQAQAAESSDTPALAAAAATSGVAFPLWASMAGLVALVILGVSATWYARSATPKPETKVSAEEFTIE